MASGGARCCADLEGYFNLLWALVAKCKFADAGTALPALVGAVAADPKDRPLLRFTMCAAVA